jgi:hypothetical protein
MSVFDHKRYSHFSGILFVVFLLAPTQNFPGISLSHESPGIPFPQESGPVRYLPSASDVQEWSPSGRAQHYKGEDLFLYINGGAEIYQEYGFKEAVVLDYKDRKGRSITLEIFEMMNSESAFGIFTFKSSGKGEPVPVGQDGRLEDYYMNFWKGSLLVTLTGFDDSAECRDGILRLAKAVDAKIRVRGAKPSLAGDLPKEWADSTRIVYLKGPIGLNNIHSFFPYDVFRFKEALAAQKDLSTFFLFLYAANEDARARFEEAKKAFIESPSYKDSKSIGPASFETTDIKGNILRIQLQGDRINLILTKLRA